MKKLKLNIDDLKIESFETNVRGLSVPQKDDDKKSPVYGYEGGGSWFCSDATDCCPAFTSVTCTQGTQEASCNGTCDISCGGTCFESYCINSCGCTDPANGTQCNTWFPSNICL